jgi:hypothetical protein
MTKDEKLIKELRDGLWSASLILSAHAVGGRTFDALEKLIAKADVRLPPEVEP